jgi:hypothetical protein
MRSFGALTYAFLLPRRRRARSNRSLVPNDVDLTCAIMSTSYGYDQKPMRMDQCWSKVLKASLPTRPAVHSCNGVKDTINDVHIVLAANNSVGLLKNPTFCSKPVPEVAIVNNASPAMARTALLAQMGAHVTVHRRGSSINALQALDTGRTQACRADQEDDLLAQFLRRRAPQMSRQA